MKALKYGLRQAIAIALAILCALSLGSATSAWSQQQTGSSQPPAEAATSSSQSPQAIEPATPADVPPQAPSTQPAATDQAPDTQKSTSEPQKQEPPAPVGTAVAPYEKGIGVGASRPAGAVIAPAKQKRTRSFLIKSALVLGAAVAVGSVVGLSNASPSRPAGAR